MAIRLDAIRDMASVIADDIDSALQVVGVVAMGEFVEILLFRDDRPVKPCLVVLDVSRYMPADELYSTIGEAFERCLVFRDEGQGSASHSEGP